MPLDPLRDDLGCVERAARPARLRVADQAGGAADQRERPVPGQLEPAQRSATWTRLPDVQARRGRVEAAVERDRAGAQRRRAARRRRSLTAISPRQASSSRTSARRSATVGPIGRRRRVTARSSRTRAAPRYRGRYALTDGSPSSQNRHGTSAPPATTPTRGPVPTPAASGTGSPGRSRQRDGAAAAAGRARRRTASEPERRRSSRAGPARQVAGRRGPRAAGSGPASTPVDHLAGAQQHGGRLAVRAGTPR